MYLCDTLYLLFCMDDCLVLSGMQGEMKLFHSTLHIRQSSIQNDKYQMSHKNSCFS